MSKLGFGLLRFKDDDYKSGRVSNLVDFAIDIGINYFDTGWDYSLSEQLMIRYVKFNPDLNVAFKLPTYYHNIEQLTKIFDIQIKRNITIPIYLLHAVNKHSWNIIKRTNIIKKIFGLKDKGKIKQVGFSFHDNLTLFKQIIEDYPWDIVYIILNPIDRHYQAGLEGLKFAIEHNVKVITMQSIKGGHCKSIGFPDINNEPFLNWSIEQYCLYWTMSQHGVDISLSGMTTIDEIIQNSHVAEVVNSDYQLNIEWSKIQSIPICNRCGYCENVCPNGVGISNIISKYLTDGPDFEIANVNNLQRCIFCKKCETVCPNSIKITDIFKYYKQ